MDPVIILEAITTAINLAAKAVQLGKDAAPFAEAIYEMIKGGNQQVTQADLDALEARLDALSADLQEALPPEDPL